MNRTIYADDCLNVLNDEIEIESNSIDLIYLDPPFNSKSNYTLPFKAKDKSARPVDVFVDTWDWDEKEEAIMERFKSGPATKNIHDLIALIRGTESSTVKYSTSAYLVNMAARLIPMRRVLKSTGSIYLHCDHSAGHYLKLIMDFIFGKDNFRNEIHWYYYNKMHDSRKKMFAAATDTLFFYVKDKSKKFTFTQLKEKRNKPTRQLVRKKVDGRMVNARDEDGNVMYQVKEDRTVDNVWRIPCLQPISKENYGYKTQKPLALLERVIDASSSPGDMILDPFCGCGTAIHAAERLNRQWAGIDISHFSSGLMRNRILSNFDNLSGDDIHMTGVPDTPQAARELAKRDKFEFEKWACGHMGAEGMFHEPGTKGADGGVDGVLKFVPTIMGKKPKEEYAIVQVKGGNVTPDAVRALTETIARFEAKAGIIICFNDQMRTVENNRSKKLFRDSMGEYPVIQGLSVEAMLDGSNPKLPPILKKAA